MHMEKATTMMIGSWRRRERIIQSRTNTRVGQRESGYGHNSFSFQIAFQLVVYRKELPVFELPEGSCQVYLIHGVVAEKQINGVLHQTVCVSVLLQSVIYCDVK